MLRSWPEWPRPSAPVPVLPVVPVRDDPDVDAASIPNPVQGAAWSSSDPGDVVVVVEVAEARW